MPKKTIFLRPNVAEEAEQYQAMMQEHINRVIQAEALELEGILAECIALSDFDHIDDIFIAVHPDGSRTVQSWWRRPEWLL